MSDAPKVTRRDMAGLPLSVRRNPIGRRDYERLLDDAVAEQIKKRFGTLCTGLGAADPDVAIAKFKDSIAVVFRARILAEEFLAEKLSK